MIETNSNVALEEPKKQTLPTKARPNSKYKESQLQLQWGQRKL